VLSNTTAGGSGTATVTFTLQNDWPADGRIHIELPPELDANMVTLQSVTGPMGTFTLNRVNQSMQITHNTGATVTTGGATIEVVLAGVTNPPGALTTSAYAVFTLESDLDVIDQANVAGTAISEAAKVIGFCRLQFPATIAGAPDDVVAVYGRLYIDGLTNQSASNNLSSLVTGWVGHGPEGSDPTDNVAWTWVEAIPNPGWDGSAQGAPNDDEYQADLVVPAAGSYDYAYRFSGDGGSTFTYCDADALGSTNGYDAANAGGMTSN
jgi:hypothetical protein